MGYMIAVVVVLSPLFGAAVLAVKIIRWVFRSLLQGLCALYSVATIECTVTEPSPKAIEQERKQSDRERRKETARRVAMNDYNYYAATLDRLKEQSAELERERRTAGQHRREQIDRTLATIDRKAFEADRKKQIAFDKFTA